MANVQKYKASSMGHMFAHYERRKDEHDEYIKYGNQSIDTSKTHLNYNLAANHNQLEFVKKRLEEVHTFKRKDLLLLGLLQLQKIYLPNKREIFLKLLTTFCAIGMAKKIVFLLMFIKTKQLLICTFVLCL